MPAPTITPDQIVQGAAAALADVALLERLTDGTCFETRAFITGVLLTAAENTRGLPVHTPLAALLAQARLDLPTKVEARARPTVWLATASRKSDDTQVVLPRAWATREAGVAWRERGGEALDALGMQVGFINVPVLGEEP